MHVGGAREEYRKPQEQGYFIHMVDDLNIAKYYLEKMLKKRETISMD